MPKGLNIYYVKCVNEIKYRSFFRQINSEPSPKCINIIKLKMLNGLLGKWVNEVKYLIFIKKKLIKYFFLKTSGSSQGLASSYCVSLNAMAQKGLKLGDHNKSIND